jgi:calreticulin
MKVILFVALAALVAAAVATTYFDDPIDDSWEKRWTVSSWKKADGTAGTWDVSAGTYFQDANKDKGLHTTQDARFYSISSKFKSFNNKGKRTVFQFSVKHQQNIDCGGGYIKLLPDGFDQAGFSGDTAYNVMFGPDICGPSHRIVHFILNRKGENRLIKRNVPAESDEFTHTYTGVLNSDNTYAIYVDGEKKQDGQIEDDWSILPPKQINDPAQSKPSDWVDDPMMDDPTDKKPADWDAIAAEIADPEAKKPDDWDEELDGKWEAPKVPNPEYKGPWRAKRINNPAYKGAWVHPQIPNPEYKSDSELYHFDSFGGVGLEIWQVKAGSIFGDFLVSDDLDAAVAAAKTINARRDAEKAAKSADDARKAAEASKAAEEKKEEKKEDL